MSLTITGLMRKEIIDVFPSGDAELFFKKEDEVLFNINRQLSKNFEIEFDDVRGLIDISRFILKSNGYSTSLGGTGGTTIIIEDAIPIVSLDASIAATNTIDLLTGITETKLDIDDFIVFTGNTDNDISFLSGETSNNTQAIIDNDDDIAFLSGETGNVISDLTSLSATTQLLLDTTGTTELIVVQARRTTDFNDIPQTWTDLIFDTTDFENDDNVIEHDDVNRDRFLIKEDGLYEVNYCILIDDEGESRVRLNDTSVVTGSFNEYGNLADAVDLVGSLKTTFVSNFSAGDFITLQVQANSGFENILSGTSVIVKKLESKRGRRGITGSGSNVTIQNNDIDVAGTPHSILNFDGNFNVTDNGSGKTTISTAMGSPIANLCELVDSAGGQQLNNVAPVPLNWNVEFLDTNVFTFTNGTSLITLDNAGYYEISYNVNSDNQSNNRMTTGVQFRLNGSTLIAKTLSACYSRNSSNDDNHNSIPACTIFVSANDTLEVVGFRLGDNNSVLTKAGASFVRIKYLGV